MVDEAPAEDRLDHVLDALESLDEAIMILDSEGRHVASNQRYNEMFFAPGEQVTPRESAVSIVRRIVKNRKVEGLNQMDEEEAVLACLIDCYSYVRGAEFALTDGRVIQVSSGPTGKGGYLMTFRDTGRDRIGERRALELLSEGFGSVDMGMILWDAALTVQMCNQAWQNLIAPVAIGTNIRDTIVQMTQAGAVMSDTGLIDSGLDDQIAKMHRQPMQFTYARTDGRLTQISTFCSTSGGVLATAIDVSERRSAEERARALLRDAVEALDIAVMHFDANRRLVLLNRAAHDIVFAQAPVPELGTTLDQLVAQLATSGNITDAPSLLAHLEDGGEAYRPDWSGGRVLEFSAHPTDMDGILVSVQDLTETIQAEREAREANALVRTIVDASPTTFLVSKVETGEILYSTGASRNRFGPITSTLSFFLDPADRDTYLAALLPTGRLDEYPVRFRRGDGSIMDGLTSARVVEFKGEQMIVSSTRDVTEYLAMQNELTAQREATAQSEKLSALGELLAGVAHELSNPMSVVLGYSLMLQDQTSDPAALRRIDRITEAAERCTKIVKMFLAMARRRPLGTEPCNPTVLVEQALQLSATALRSSGLEIEQRIGADLPLVEADRDQIIQVLINLITNAMHALAPLSAPGKICINAYRAPGADRVLIEVSDNGTGVPDDIRHRIFEPFFTTKEVGAGTGVGLAFCHRTVAAHGGELTVHTAPEGGALFRISLPRSDSTQYTTWNDDTPHPLDHDKRVLVLDDEHNVAQMLRDVLQGAGFRVETFKHGEDALRRATDRGFDALLCDIRMPGMDGPTFFRRLVQKAPDQARRLIFLTGDAMSPDVADFLASIDQPHVEKPVIPAELVTAIHGLISRDTP